LPTPQAIGNSKILAVSVKKLLLLKIQDQKKKKTYCIARHVFYLGLSIATMIHFGPRGYKEMSSILADQ
jgi:hypothetical protein